MDLMAARRRLMQMQELPSAYRRVEYLESSGVQYIDTDIIPSNSLGFDCTFYPLSEITGGADFGCIFGSRKGSGNNDFQLTTYSDSNKGSFRYGGSATANAEIQRSQINTVYKRNLTFIDGKGKIYDLNSYNWQTNVPISLFILRENNSHIQGGRGNRIYKIKFYDGNTLTNSFIPCVRKADSKPGIYDTVSKTFYTNAGTGEFIIPS